eukprot:1149748-Pelagomonas_calceolata.AAC.1
MPVAVALHSNKVVQRNTFVASVDVVGWRHCFHAQALPAGRCPSLYFSIRPVCVVVCIHPRRESCVTQDLLVESRGERGERPLFVSSPSVYPFQDLNNSRLEGGSFNGEAIAHVAKRKAAIRSKRMLGVRFFCSVDSN